MRWLGALMILIVAGVSPARGDSDPFTIVMIVWRGCEDACKGFQDYFRESGTAVSITVRDAERDRERLPSFAREAKEMKADLVVTWGTSVTRGIVGRIGEVDPAIHVTEIPVVFMIVADPIGAKIVESYEGSGRANITGTRNRVPEEVQINALRAYRPFDRLGLIYNTNELNARLKAEELRALAEMMGFELIEATIELGGDGKPMVDAIPKAIAEAKARKADFLYVASSSFLMANRDFFTRTALEQGVPVAAAYEAMAAKSHALLALASRYYNVGKLAGFQAAKILVDGIAPKDLPIRGLDRFSYIINMETARKLKLYPPLTVLRYAEIVDPKLASR